LPDSLVLDVVAGHICWTNMGDPKRNDGWLLRSELNFEGEAASQSSTGDSQRTAFRTYVLMSSSAVRSAATCDPG
jgi:hypothetical protein